MQVFAARLPVDLEKSYPGAKRVILRDVARTDRNYHFFRLGLICRKTKKEREGREILLEMLR